MAAICSSCIEVLELITKIGEAVNRSEQYKV